MKMINKNELALGSIDPESDLEWMLQSEQISDSALIRVLVHDFYPRIFQLAMFYLGERDYSPKLTESQSKAITQQDLPGEARDITEQALLKVVMCRHRYWGEPELTAWVLGLAFQVIQKAEPVEQTLPTEPTPGSVDPELGKLVAMLDKKQRLLLLLRYSYKLDVPAIAHILKAKERTILTDLQTTRETVWEKLSINEQKQSASSPRILHRYIHRQLHADMDAYSGADDKETLLEHLKECPACQEYAAELDVFEKRLSVFLNTIWPDPVFVDNDKNIIQDETTLRLENGGFRRHFSISFKESAIVGLVILAVIAVGWGIKIMAPNVNPSTSANRQSNQSMLDSIAIRPSPANSDPKALPTDDPGSERAWFNSNAITPPESFINLNQTISDTDPVTDTKTMSQSGAESMGVLMRYWGSIGKANDRYNRYSQGVDMTPFEIVRFINSNTDLMAISRVGGDVDTIKNLVAAGFPVIVERGLDNVSPDGMSNWAGVFNVINGYDDAQQTFITISAFQLPVVYTGIYVGSFVQQWRAFNYEYLVIYKPSQEKLVNQILGSQADTNQNYHYASEKASMDAYNSIYVRDQFFAWFNLGTNLTYLRKYQDAVTTFDQAFSLYKKIPESELPWRIFWYQTDFFQAYYATGRYQDVIDLATMIINGPSTPQTEDSYYWRALAEEALGNRTGAIQDLETSLKINSNFKLGITRLEKLMSSG
jgi:DNA-directed RNA polymerase specialized sigma24 family protein